LLAPVSEPTKTSNKSYVALLHHLANKKANAVIVSTSSYANLSHLIRAKMIWFCIIILPRRWLGLALFASVAEPT
jgi:hypothetical protein